MRIVKISICFHPALNLILLKATKNMVQSYLGLCYWNSYSSSVKPCMMNIKAAFMHFQATAANSERCSVLGSSSERLHHPRVCVLWVGSRNVRGSLGEESGENKDRGWNSVAPVLESYPLFYNSPTLFLFSELCPLYILALVLRRPISYQEAYTEK